MQEQPIELELYRRARELTRYALREGGLPEKVLAVGVRTGSMTRVGGPPIVMCQPSVSIDRLRTACALILSGFEAGDTVCVVRDEPELRLARSNANTN